MGIKQHFASFAYEGAEPRELREVWRELQASGDFSKVAVFDTSNFLLGLQKHPFWRTDTPVLPRVQELQQLLSLLLTSLQRDCPGVQLHFIADGVSMEEELASKATEHQRREAGRMLESAMEAQRFVESGSARGGGFDALPLLLRAVRALDGEHFVGRAHALSMDLDVAVVLHAQRHRAGLLFSSDSDFLVLFQGRVLQLESLAFTAGGRLAAKSLSLQQRLARFGLESWQQLRLLAFLAGSDFHAPQLELPWSEMAAQARELSKLGAWQDVVRAEGGPEAFLENFDVEALQLLSGEPEAWGRDDAALGITAMLPEGPLDPLLQRFAEEGDEEMARLVRAYARGQLGGSTLQFMRHQRASVLPVQGDMLGEASVVRLKEAAWERLLALVAGQVPLAWDEEPVHFRAASVRKATQKARALGMRAVPGLLALEKAQQPAAAASVREELQRCRSEAVEGMLRAGPVEEVPMKVLDVPDWLFEGREPEAEPKARVRSAFFVATGADLKELGRPLQRAELLVHALTALAKDDVAPHHLQHAAAALGTEAGRSGAWTGAGEARSALILGELCRWLPKFLEDVHCICGGPPLDLLSLPFAGGPVLLTEGWTHKAKSGYSIHLRAPDGVEVSEAATEAAKERVRSMGGSVVRSFASGGFKVGGLAPEQAWSLHQTLLIHSGTLCKLKVKALD